MYTNNHDTVLEGSMYGILVTYTHHDTALEGTKKFHTQYLRYNTCKIIFAITIIHDTIQKVKKLMYGISATYTQMIPE